MAPPSLPRLESPLPAEQMDQQLAIVVASGGDLIALSPAPATFAGATPPDPNILDVFIPRVRQTFETKKEAYQFYYDYARLAGFSVRVKRTSKETAGWVCNQEGFLKIDKENNEPQIEKTSERVGYPAYAKVKQDKKANQWYFDHVEEAHNHKLHPSPRMVRNAEQASEERDADLEKLFQFFRECKTSNEYFYFDVDFDPKTKVLRSIFWSHASQRVECKDFGDVITFHTTHKTNRKNMPLGMFVGANNNLKNFEEEWNKLVQECEIDDNPAINALWEKRKSWIATYFKGMYYGKMTSTQRSESQNRAKVIRTCKSRFDEQLSRVYMRAVYQENTKEYANSTAFLIEPNPHPDVRNGYLVRHEKGAGSFCWAQHAFKVVADKETGVYECECKQWEHTWLFCMHIIRAFTHLQVQSIPKKYIFKRYMCDARSLVPWDRHDVVQNVDAATSTLDCSAAIVETNENQAEINLDPTSTNFLAGISLVEPPVSRTRQKIWQGKSMC
ncbi:protein FAR1-RELATED SEQUENCE 1-like [Miscanthus floridulus]|uniref:protein FAR1-RELATED SEQUENCE 1-like n=1 Tax=Miscanthus floridulus TaxID=154761 RepID=UPI00345A447B